MLVREALGQECHLESVSLIWRVGRYIPSRCVTKSKEYDAGNARGATETSVASSESLRQVFYTCVLSLVPWPPPNPIQASMTSGLQEWTPVPSPLPPCKEQPWHFPKPGPLPAQESSSAQRVEFKSPSR